MNSEFSVFKLGEVTEIFAGGDKPKIFSEDKSESNNVPIFANAEKKDGLYGYTNTPRIVDSAVTVAARGSNVGFVAVRKEPFFPIVRLLSLIPNRKRLDVDYLYYNLKQNRLNGTGSGQPQITIPNISNRNISLPSLLTQQKTAKILSDLDEKIELNSKINAELEAMAKLIYDYWFVQFDFPDENGKPYKSSGGLMVYNEELKREIPEGWEVKGINEVIEVKDGTHDSPKSQDNGFKLITSKHLKKEGLDFESANYISEEDYININKRSKVDSGDILFSMIGNIGTVYKIEEETIDFAIKNVALYKTSAHLEMRNYVYMYLRGYNMQSYMGNVIAGSIQKFIGLGSLRKMPLMNDSKTISKFEEKTNFIFKEMNVLKVQNQKLAELRDWLLPMLMNGQVRVN